MEFLSLYAITTAVIFGVSFGCLCRRSFYSIKKRKREEDLELDSNSKRPKLDDATTSEQNPVAPEVVPEPEAHQVEEAASPEPFLVGFLNCWNFVRQ